MPDLVTRTCIMWSRDRLIQIGVPDAHLGRIEAVYFPGSSCLRIRKGEAAGLCFTRLGGAGIPSAYSGGIVWLPPKQTGNRSDVYGSASALWVSSRAAS